jgi:demethylmenaquinone methyltransferase/2-methoxy-6-polyprenyl-1,4-benzoquinol methylase
MPDATPGTTPQGISDEKQAAAWVQSMFGGIARHYDLLNHLLSFNFDRYWRWRTVRRLKRELPSGGRVLDLCCGTGDLLIGLEREFRRPAIGADFCHPMLTAARSKLDRKRLRSALVEADGLQLPLRDDSLDAITIGFGFRNFANYRRGLAEMRRVLKPGGIVAILEFSQPRTQPCAAMYGWFSTRVLPRIGGAVSGSSQAYSYLPESIRRFPDAPQLADEMKTAGYPRVEYERMTGGIVALHLGWKATAPNRPGVVQES